MLGPRSNRLGSLLERGRARNMSRMRDACVIKRPGKKTSDGRGGETVEMAQIYPDPDWHDDHPYADGKCWVSYPGVAYESTYDSAGVTIVQGRIEVNLPVEPAIEENDIVTMTMSEDNPRIVGMEFRVASDVPRSQGVRQKILCEHNQKGVNDGQD